MARFRPIPVFLRLGVVTAFLVCGGPARLSAQGLVDHHAHLLSTQLVRDWKGMGVPFSRPDSFYTSASPLLGGAPPLVGRAILVPMGHIYATEDFESLRLTPSQEEARVAGENDHVAREASRWGSRAVALCSVPVLRLYALRELERCRRHPAVRGVKVHVASSGVDLREPQHRATMGAIAAWAAAERLPMLLHLDPQRRGHDSTHIEQFMYELLSGNPTLTVVIAHAGGSGGYGSWVRQVLHAAHRADARVSRGDAPGALYFDLSAVVLERASEGVPATSDSARTLFAADVRRIGLERFVFGSDWPVFGPGETISSLQRALGLTDAAAASWGERALAVFFP